MPLTMAGTGETNTVNRISGSEETRRYLENLGFVSGTSVTVVSKNGGNLIINVKDSRIAVNREMAKRIMVL